MQSSEGYVTAEDGIRLFFQTLGNGPKTAVFANGRYLMQDFQRFANGRTLIFYDVRNFGRSDAADVKLARGIQQDVDDLEAVRRHFGIDKIAAAGHSYTGKTLILYAMKHPERVSRLLQIGPIEPYAGKQYPTHLTGADETLADFFRKASELQQESVSLDPKELCRRFWALLRVIYVANPADAEKIQWSRCDEPNAMSFLNYWNQVLLPSIQNLALAPEQFARVTCPVLTIHGRKDRSAPYGGARDWAMSLPNARLVTVENAAHAPWVEDPEKVFGAMETFLDGVWPPSARIVTSLDTPAAW